jgi:hypothetical protein
MKIMAWIGKSFLGVQARFPVVTPVVAEPPLQAEAEIPKQFDILIHTRNILRQWSLVINLPGTHLQVGGFAFPE